jgi:hypothetical protein
MLDHPFSGYDFDIGYQHDLSFFSVRSVAPTAYRPRSIGFNRETSQPALRTGFRRNRNPVREAGWNSM